MEPISVAASAITIAHLAARTCNAFASLRDLCKSLPGRLHALNNEVADLELVLVQIATVFQERPLFIPQAEVIAIPRLLQQASDKLNELHAAVERLNTACDRTKVSILQAHAWRREHPKLTVIQQTLKSIKCDLNLALGASNSHDMLRIRLDLENIATVTSHLGASSIEKEHSVRDEVLTGLASHKKDLTKSLDQISERVDQRISNIEEMLKMQSQTVQSDQSTQLGPLYRSRPPYHRRPSPPSVTTSPNSMTTRAEAVRVRLNRFTSTCRKGCPCACHTSSKTATPALIDSLLGQMFIGYAGLPLLSPKCNSKECGKAQSPQVNLEYWFPLGFFWSQIIQLQVGYQPNVGPQMSLSTLRRIPDSAQCVNYALSGNIDGLKDLFSHGLASPVDVSSTRGYSLLRWALYGKQYSTCKFLVHAGADPDYRPISLYDNSPKNKAFDFLLQGGLSRTAKENLTCLTQGGDFIDEQNYTPLHRIVLGLSLRSLDEELILHPDDIDVPDALGRTPLIWAAARGNEKVVALLLSAGADPNALDNQYTNGASYAAEQNHVVCVRLLLEAGADPDPILPAGIRVGSALNCASRNATDPLVPKTLLDFGADVEASGVEGITPFINAARTDNVSFALLFLEYGANINATSTLGQTPLTTAIAYNSHRVLKLLLGRWSEYTECPRVKGPNLLQIAASYADLETINILTNADHFAIKSDQSYGVGDFSSQLRQRPDVSEKLVLALEDLISLIGKEPASCRGSPSLMEAGLIPYPHSDAIVLEIPSENGCQDGEPETPYDDAVEHQ